MLDRLPIAGGPPPTLPSARAVPATATDDPERQPASGDDPLAAAREGAADQVVLSKRGLALAGLADESERRDSGEAADPRELTDEERAEVAELRRRDREVRQHEQAHAAAGGSLTGAPRYTYERGPDGVRYAVGGEVSIQLREGRTPEETLRIAEQARRAALAPAEPSPQDRRVANEADQMARRARDEIRTAEAAEQRDTGRTSALDADEERPELPPIFGARRAAEAYAAIAENGILADMQELALLG
ncbi:MAG: putative metalloprotease CJM1_0395 family protein [Planctomycetota bacterium]